MKPRFLAPLGVWSLGASLLLGTGVRAQNASPLALPPVVQSGATVAVPVASNESKVRLRLRNGAAYLDEETVKREGNVANARLEAEPGLYTLRAFATGKNGVLVGTPLEVVVPGLRREAGVWLFNGSIWIRKAAPVGGGNPTFLSDLRRDDKAKLPVNDPTPQLLRWNAVPLNLPATNVDFAGGPPAQSGAPAVGYLVEAQGEMNDVAPQLKNFGRARALILSIDVARDPLLAARQIENAAPNVDAIVLNFSATAPLVPQLWPLKMARRMAEETPDYDLPIFADVSAGGFSDAQLLELYQNGATGFLAAPGAPEPSWLQLWDANSNWLTGAVTLEDMGVLNTNSPRLESLLGDLRAGGRVPLVGRLPDEKHPKGESNMILLDNSTAAATLDGAKKAATEGNTVYLEGLPAASLYAKMGEITGTEIKTLPAPRDEILTLDDPWLWGAIAGREFSVTQRISLTLKQSLAAQTKEQKGLALETIARAGGKLTGDPNGWIVAPVGKGRILWAPHPFVNATDKASYYAAVAGAMQSALASLSGDTENVRLALRATQGQTALLALFNDGKTPAKLSVEVRGNSALVMDLMSDETVKSAISGYQTQFDLVVPAGGFRWLSLAVTKEDFEKERAFKRVKARLK